MAAIVAHGKRHFPWMSTGQHGFSYFRFDSTFELRIAFARWGSQVKREALSEDLRRFVDSIPTVASLEAILLLRQSQEAWELKTIARRLYMSERSAVDLMRALCRVGICLPHPELPGHFLYHPAERRLAELIDRLARYYAKNLIEVSNMIHANAGAVGLEDAFRWREEEQ
jgi:AraC-like DNA-binding protein